MKAKNFKTAAALSAVLLAAVLIIAVLVMTAQAEPTILGGVPEPDDTVELFFDSLCAGELEICDSMLYGYSSLGLDGEPETETGALLLSAALDSLSWKQITDCTVDGLDAVCTVELTHLDTASMTEAVRESAGEKLERFAANAASNDSLYNADGSYREDVIMQLFDQALGETLAQSEQYLVTRQIDIALSYTGGKWRIRLSSGLIAAITGNLVSQGGTV